MKKDTKGFYALRISDSVQMDIGVNWKFETLDGKEYTIFLESTKKNQNYIQLSNGEYYVSLVEGHTISENIPSLTSAIKEVETVKD